MGANHIEMMTWSITEAVSFMKPSHVQEGRSKGKCGPVWPWQVVKHPSSIAGFRFSLPILASQMPLVSSRVIMPYDDRKTNR